MSYVSGLFKVRICITVLIIIIIGVQVNLIGAETNGVETAHQPAYDGPPFGFAKSWESELHDAAVHALKSGDFDGDGLTDLILPYYGENSPNAWLHIYELAGDNSFNDVWSSDSLLNGVVTDIEIDDLDADGNKEIIVSQLSNYIRIFENSGDNEYTAWPSIELDFLELGMRVENVEVADTDNNGIKEFLFTASSNFGEDDQEFYIIENGQVIFDVSFFREGIREIHVGNLDGDAYQDIVLVQWKWNPDLNLNGLLVYEYNGTDYEVYDIVMPGVGARVAEITDIDLDGQNELIVGGSAIDTLEYLMVIEAVADNEYEIVSQTPFPYFIQPLMDMSVADILGGDNPEIAVATHGSGSYHCRIMLYDYDAGELGMIYTTDDDFEYAPGYITAIDIGFADDDILPDMLFWAYGKFNMYEFTQEYFCGDINGNFAIGILDITHLIAFLYNGGIDPVSSEFADVNNSGNIDILDIVYLIEYLFMDGPIPGCN